MTGFTVLLNSLWLPASFGNYPVSYINFISRAKFCGYEIKTWQILGNFVRAREETRILIQILGNIQIWQEFKRKSANGMGVCAGRVLESSPAMYISMIHSIHFHLVDQGFGYVHANGWVSVVRCVNLKI